MTGLDLSLRWRPRATPLEPVAVVGVGAVARALGLRAARAPEAERAAWRGVAGAGVFVLLGPSASLPWVEGAVYLGRDALAPSLLVPCALEPEVAVALLERALVAGRDDAPLAVLPGSRLLVPVAGAQPLAPVALEVWLASRDAEVLA